MDNYTRMVTFNRPEYLPVSVSLLPGTWLALGEELEEIVLRHPIIFPGYEKGKYKNTPLRGFYKSGKKTDVWGCVWDSVVDGYDSVCIGHPLSDREDILTLKIPEEDAGTPHGFMFLRLTYLRGYEECMIDFAEECPELQILIDKVVEYNSRQIGIQLREMRGDDLHISFGDDLGTQTALPTGPHRWRKYLKPAFAKLYGPCKSAGKLVYMHTDGCIWEIIPDLKDCGVDIVNPQFRANGLDRLKEVTRGEGRNRIAVNLDLDRQMFPFASPSELEDHVMECVDALGSPEGGLSLTAECAGDVPPANIEALCRALERARVYFS